MSADRRTLSMLLAVTLVATIASRVAGPSDLYDQEQPRTVSYTIDMLEHGRWALPRDGDGIRATKPVLYNWIAAPFVAVFGPREWALKMPSLLGGIATLLIVVWTTRLMSRRALTRGPNEPGGIAESDRDVLRRVGPDAVALAAGAIWLTNYAAFKLIYLARPDTVLVAFLAGAWACATAVVLADEKEATATEAEDDNGPPCESRSSTWRWSLGFWLCTGGAALAKGPLAVLVMLYALLAAPLMGGRWRDARRFGWWWGLPLSLAMFAAWLVPAYLTDPAAFEKTIIEEQVVSRVEQGTLWYLVTSAWQVPFLTLTRFLPWSLFVVLALIHLPLRRWFRHALAPAVLWTLIVAGVFLLTTKRADRLAPIFIGFAPLAAYWLVIVANKYRLTATAACAAGLVVAIGLGVYNFTASPAAKSRYGERVHAFAADVRDHVGDDAVAIVGVRDRVNPLATLLNHARGAEDATDQQRLEARWIIRPIDENAEPSSRDAIVVSDLVPNAGGVPQRLGLFRVE